MRPTTRDDYRKRLLRVLVHIEEHLDEELALEDLARVVFFSPYHFHRIFRGMVGESVAEHVRRLRLERGARALRLTDRPVTRIALDAGYETHEAFTRAFHARFGESPSAFRKSSAPAPAPRRARLSRSRAPLPPVEVRELAPLRVAFLRHVGPYQEVGPAWGGFLFWAGARGLLREAPRILGVCHDDPDVTPAGKLRYDACLPVGEDFRAEGSVGVQTIAGGPYAVMLHVGPYERLSEAYLRLVGEWLPRSRREARAAPVHEAYLNTPQDTPPEKLRTELYLPLEER